MRPSIDRIPRTSLAVLAVAASLWNGALFAARPPAIRGLLGEKVDLVVRAAVLDQERAPAGLWHRLQVEEVLWQKEGSEPAGPTIRVFAHGPGVPEGAELAVGEEVVLGVARFPADATGLDPFRARLLESFSPDRPGERPALVAPDGIVDARSDPAAAVATVRLVRGMRRERDGFFLRAESLYNVATEIDRLNAADERSHDLRRWYADLREPSGRQIVGKEKFLNSFRQKDSADNQTDENHRPRGIAQK